jgi:hypothetical protein
MVLRDKATGSLPGSSVMRLCPVETTPLVPAGIAQRAPGAKVRRRNWAVAGVLGSGTSVPPPLDAPSSDCCHGLAGSSWNRSIKPPTTGNRSSPGPRASAA